MKIIAKKSQFKGENYPNLFNVYVYDDNPLEAIDAEFPNEKGMVINSDEYTKKEIKKYLDYSNYSLTIE